MGLCSGNLVLAHGGLLLLLFYFTAFLALIKSVRDRSLKECRPGSFGWVHSNSNPVIQFSSTTGFQRTGTHGRRQVYAVHTCIETRIEGNSWRILR